jgi:Type I phosphodiesterase / nucleotide pyrophosphatase
MAQCYRPLAYAVVHPSRQCPPARGGSGPPICTASAASSVTVPRVSNEPAAEISRATTSTKPSVQPSLPPALLLPDYGGACIDGLSPAFLAPPGQRPAWLPAPLRLAQQVVLLVLDGLGWLQLQDRLATAPALAGLEGGPISSVAPTTTATALTSLALGRAPAAHGIVGYKFAVDGPSGREVLNVLRWSTPSGDARQFLPPVQVQPEPAFGGRPVPVVSRSDFSGTGFSQAHQRGAREVSWVVPSSLPVLVGQLLAEGEPYVYAYYDGIDKVAHAAGLGALYDAELRAADRVVADLLSALPPGAVLAVTADHGQVDVGPRAGFVAPEVASRAALISGEARFRWLHSHPGGDDDLFECALSTYGDEAWVATRDEVLAAGVLGGIPSEQARARLGDVVIIPCGDNAYLDPRDAGDARLVCRHGGLSPAEVLVPLLCG